jgi:excisionase family DNA binding protein
METSHHVGLVSVPKVLLTVDEAAEAMSLSRSYVYELVMRNRIRSVKVGRKRRIPVLALHDFVSHQLAEMEKGA